MDNVIHPSVRPSVCLSGCRGFAAVGPVARRYRSIAAWPAVSSSRVAARRAVGNAGSATLSAVNQREFLLHKLSVGVVWYGMVNVDLYSAIITKSL